MIPRGFEYHKATTLQHAIEFLATHEDANKPDAHFPETISQLVLTTVIPASMVNEYGTSFTGFESDAPVIGAYYPVNYQLGQTEMTLLRNPYFFPQPIACQLDLTFVEGTSQGVSLLKGGAEDLAQLDPASVAAAIGNPNVHVLIQNDTYITTLDYNVTDYPFNMTAFRQALVYGINENQIVQQALNGFGEAAYNAEGTVPPEISNYYNPNQVSYQYNTTKALALLNSIGMTVVNGHLQYPNGSAVTLTFWGDDTYSWDSILSGIVQTNLQSLGIAVNLQLTTFGDLASMTSLAPDTMYLNSNNGVVFPSASVDAEPGWDVYILPGIANAYWEYPPSANAEYESNLTAIENTANTTLLQSYVYNVQALNAQYLPVVTLDYVAGLWGYSTQRWMNWTTYPSGWIHMNSNFNNLEFANLVPVGYTSTSTSTAPTSTSTAPTSTSTTTSTSSSSNYILIAGIVVAIVIIAGAATYLIRRRR